MPANVVGHRVIFIFPTAPVRRPHLLEIRDDEWSPGVIGRGRWLVRHEATAVNVEFTAIVDSSNRAIFQC